MQKRPNIKWRNTDIEKLDTIIKRFNSKVEYHKKNHPESAELLPNKIRKADFMKTVQTRQDYNREIKSLQRFLVKGAEKPFTSKTGITLTHWEKKEIALKVNRINRERANERKRIEELEVSTHGLKTGLKRGEMGAERMNALKPKKFDIDKIRKGKEWELFKASVEKQATSNASIDAMKQYKMNYLKALSRVMGEHGDYITRKLKQLPPEFVTELFYKEQEASIDFVYDPQELQVRLDIIEEIWENAYNDNPDIVSDENWSASEETELNKWIDKGW